MQISMSWIIIVSFNLEEYKTAKWEESSMYTILSDGTQVYYEKIGDGKYRLTSVVRDGMTRSNGGQVFNSLSELQSYCESRNWSKY